MSIVRINLDVTVSLDTEDYVLPSDGRIGASVKDEITEAINVNTALEVQTITITRVSKFRE